jgi:hypothetical protein
MAFQSVGLDELIIDDDEIFETLPLYAGLKRTLRHAGHRFLLPRADSQTSWDRALFLNLTYWSAEDGAEVLCDNHIPADVVAHAAWHHLVAREVTLRAGPGTPSASALFFAESIASAFDLYLVGRLMHVAPEADFVLTQIPIMQEAAAEAGLAAPEFRALLEDICSDPERAFEELRTLLFDATTALAQCRGATEAARIIETYEGHRFAPLLHHYQLSNWILYARAYAQEAPAQTEAVRQLDEALRQANGAVKWLALNWLEPAPAPPLPDASASS